MIVDISELDCVKSCRKFLINALIFTVLFAIIFFAIIFYVQKGEPNMDELFKEIAISLISGLVSSVIVTVIAYYKFLKRIPEDTQKKIDKLLNDRLSYETSNHNCVMNALSPNNEFLSTEHRAIQTELGSIKENIISIKEKRNVDYSIVDNAGKSILKSIDNLSNFSNAFVFLTQNNQRLEEENKNLAQELKDVKQAYNRLQKQTKIRNNPTRDDEIKRVYNQLQKQTKTRNNLTRGDMER